MADLSEVSVLLAAAIVLFASTVKGAIGFGFPIVAVPLLSNLADPRTVVVSMAIPVLLSNVLILGKIGITREALRRMATLFGALVVFTIVGAHLLAVLPLNVISVVVGATAVTFVTLTAAGKTFVLSANRDRLIKPLVGGLSGLLAGTTNICGPVLVSYLHTLRLSKREFVSALTILFSVAGTTQVASYTQLGLLTNQVLLFSVLASIPMFAGVFIGLKIQDRLSSTLFNRVVLTVVFLSGVNLIVRGTFG